MKKSARKSVISVVYWIVVFTGCALATAETNNRFSQSGSYAFDSVTIGEALREISRDTGITIKAPFDALGKIIEKNYENVAVDEVVTDLLRQQNYAIIWHYRDQKLVTIDIRIGDQENESNMPPALSSGSGHRRVTGKAAGPGRPSFPSSPSVNRHRGARNRSLPPGI